MYYGTFPSPVIDPTKDTGHFSRAATCFTTARSVLCTSNALLSWYSAPHISSTLSVASPSSNADTSITAPAGQQISFSTLPTLTMQHISHHTSKIKLGELYILYIRSIPRHACHFLRQLQKAATSLLNSNNTRNKRFAGTFGSDTQAREWHNIIIVYANG